MTRLKPGLKGRSDMRVAHDDLASVMGNIGAEVLSTHRVVLLMELAARDAIAGCLPEGMMTVGTGIRIRHLAATPLGVKVWAEACLRDIMGHRLVFDVVARRTHVPPPPLLHGSGRLFESTGTILLTFL